MWVLGTVLGEMSWFATTEAGSFAWWDCCGIDSGELARVSPVAGPYVYRDLIIIVTARGVGRVIIACIHGTIPIGSLFLWVAIPILLWGSLMFDGCQVSGRASTIFPFVHDFEAVVCIDRFYSFDCMLPEGFWFWGTYDVFGDVEGESLEEELDDRPLLDVIVSFLCKHFEFLDILVNVSIFHHEFFYGFMGLCIALGVNEAIFECLEEIAP